MENDEETPEQRRERWRSVAVHARPTPSKKVVHHTDTAVVTETHSDNRLDTHVAINEAATLPRRD